MAGVGQVNADLVRSSGRDVDAEERVVLASLQLGTAILAEATISFLGQGVTNFPTWGQMLSGQTRTFAENHMYLALFPGTAIFLAVFGFNMLGDALRDVLDPRLRGTR